MKKEKIIGIRVDQDLYNKLKELKITSTELRKVIIEYVEKRLGEPPKPQDKSQKNQDASKPPETLSRVHEILRQFENKCKEYIELLKQFCREHAREKAQEIRVKEDYLYEYCKYELRRHAYNTMRDKYHEYVEPLIPSEHREYAEREVYKILNKMVKELYPHTYPPVRL